LTPDPVVPAVANGDALLFAKDPKPLEVVDPAPPVFEASPFVLAAEPKVAKGDCADPASEAKPEAANALAEV